MLQSDITSGTHSTKGKFLVFLPIALAAVIFGGIDYLSQERSSQKDANGEYVSWIKSLGGPLRDICNLSIFGNGTSYSYRLFAFWTLMAIFFTLLVMIPYFLSYDPETGKRNVRFLYMALFMGPLLLVIEDYSYYVWEGTWNPNWAGPVPDAGFTWGLPTFYWPFIIWGITGTIIWLFYEHKLKQLYEYTEGVF